MTEQITIKPIPRPCRGCGAGEAEMHIDDCPAVIAAVEAAQNTPVSTPSGPSAGLEGQDATQEPRDATEAALRAELDTYKRGAKELGRILDNTLRDALDASGLHHLINEDGDGDWALVWEHLAELRPRAEAAEATLAKVRAYAKEREAYGRRGRTVHSARIASDLLAILDAPKDTTAP